MKSDELWELPLILDQLANKPTLDKDERKSLKFLRKLVRAYLDIEAIATEPKRYERDRESMYGGVEITEKEVAAAQLLHRALAKILAGTLLTAR